MAKNKFIWIFLFSFLFLFFNNTVFSENAKKVDSLPDSESEKIQFYAPQFYDENNNAISGDGMLIIFPNKQVMLVDCFSPQAAPQFISFIKERGISKIDYIVATHYHSDHIGSLTDILSSFEIGTLFTNGAPINNNSTKLLEDYISSHQINRKILKQGDFFSAGDVNIEVLWPNLSEQDIYDIMNNPGKTARLINLSSIVFKLTYKNFSMLFTGDIYKDGDKQLVKKYGSKLHCTILKAPHHGDFYTANSSKFLKTVKSDYAVIQDNRYITNIIKNRYKNAKIKLLYSLKPGYVKIESDGTNYTVNKFNGYQE